MGQDDAGWIEVKQGSRVKTIKSPTTTLDTALANNAFSVLATSIKIDCLDPPQTIMPFKLTKKSQKISPTATNPILQMTCQTHPMLAQTQRKQIPQSQHSYS